ncbi:MAG: hypothetical protein JWP91_2177 [Fibrobacteres bacterium]|nr:hypothetical protein [Fibrobacterota bacterium]
MVQPLLKSLSGASLLAAALSALLLAATGCAPFDDPLLELDPAFRDSTLTAVPPGDQARVARVHFLESFGSYGCVSCPDAESRLAPYIHADAAGRAGPRRLVVVNYHVKFGSIADPWVTPAIQAWNDANGYASLPQAVMDGSNAAYGVRGKDVAFKEGEYDSLASRALRSDSLSWLELRLDTLGIAYDTSSPSMGRIRLRFEARNRGSAALGALDFRVLAVKNRPAAIRLYPTPWEVIVAEMTEADAQGRPLSLPALPGLTSKSFLVDLIVPSENGKHPNPPPLGPETLTDYALVVTARDRNGMVMNAGVYRYGPKAP